MLRINRGVALGLWAATLIAVFAIGRITAPSDAFSAPEDLGASIRAALAEPDQLERLGRTAHLLEHLDPDNLPEVRAVYDQLLAVIDQWDIRSFVAAWARFDPAGALDHTLAWPYKIKQKTGVEAAIRGWALRHPLEARMAFRQVSVEYPDLREGLFLGLLSGWVNSGQEGLERHIANLSSIPRDQAIALVVGALMRKGGPDAAMRWADSILQEEAYEKKFKLSAFRHAIRSVARWHPERAAAWAVEHTGNEYALDGPRIVVEQWAQRDGMAAMQWVRAQPAGEPRDQAAREAFIRWMRSDPEGAKAWLDDEALTSFHDPVVNAYARLVDAHEPEEAIAWCERLLESGLRGRCLKSAATHWYRQDAVAAEVWLQQSPLDEEARRAVRTPPSKRPRKQGGVRPDDDAF